MNNTGPFSCGVFLAVLGATSPTQKQPTHAYIYTPVSEVGLFWQTGSKNSLAGITAARWRVFMKKKRAGTGQEGHSLIVQHRVREYWMLCEKLASLCLLGKQDTLLPICICWEHPNVSDRAQCLSCRYGHQCCTSHFHSAFHPRDLRLPNWGMDGSCSLFFALCLRKQRYQEPKRLAY